MSESEVEPAGSAATEPTSERTLPRRRMLRHLGVTVAVAGAVPVLPSIRISSAPPEPMLEEMAGLPAETGDRSEPTTTPIAFSTIGFDLAESGDLEFRTSADGSAWTDWTPVERLDADLEGPDVASAEDSPRWEAMSAPVWVGTARWLQVRGADPRRVRPFLIGDPTADESPMAWLRRQAGEATEGMGGVAHAASQPSIITRSQWGANEDWAGSPSYASSLRFAVVHHTAGSNDYSQSDVPQLIRNIYHYHTQVLGWKDIGYNFLVDKWGRVYEGRKGGVDRAVIGAHARGYNTGSVGVAALGSFGSSATVRRDMLDGIDRLLAWKFKHHGIDPYGTATVGSHTIPTIVGHRDVGSTACPGDRLYGHVRGSTDPMDDRVAMRMQGFVDVPSGSTFAEDIFWLASVGITKGANPPKNDRFAPKREVTREEMAAFLVRAMGLRDDSHPGFSDVPSGSTFDRDIRRLAKAEVTQGCNPPQNSRYCPGDAVRREEMASFLVRAVGLTDDDHPGFRDVPAGSTFDRDIRRLAKAGITRGYNPPTNDLFAPKETVTREQMAAFLHRAFG